MDETKDCVEQVISECRKDLIEFLNELRTGKNELGGNISKLIFHDYNIVLKKHIELFTGKISWTVEDLGGQ